MITSNLLTRVAPNSKRVADIIPGLFYQFSNHYEINTPKRIAAFFAETIVESASFTATREFASGAAYEGREDLGNVFKGDGKKFKGRGYIQITGRNNYSDCSRALFGNSTLLDNPDLLSTPKYAMQSAMWFWENRGLNEQADKQFFLTISIRVNGKNFKTGLPNNWADRVHYYNLLCAEFGLPLYDIEAKNIITS